MDKKMNAGNGLRRDILVVVVVALIGLMLGLNLFFFFSDGPTRSLVGRQAPDFELSVLGEEEPVRLSDFRGQVVMMDFWATWCPPCRDQMPALESIATSPEWTDEVVVISINTDQDSDDRLEKVEDFMQELKLTLPSAIDHGEARQLYHVSTIPTLVVIDKDGEVTHVSQGLHEEERLRSLLLEAGASGRLANK